MTNGRLTALIVDDSRIFRNVMAEVLANIEKVKVIGSVHNGAKAVEFIRAQPPDLVFLDLEMPVMNGLEALKAIQQFNAAHPELGPGVGVIMVSALTRKGADVTIKALEEGAFDFVTKPAGNDLNENKKYLQQQLFIRINNFMLERRVIDIPDCRRPEPPPAAAAAHHASTPPSPTRPLAAAAVGSAVKAIIIGVSTGGPKALDCMLPVLSELVELPILIVQHMPATFTASLADSLNTKCRHKVIEAVNGGAVEDRCVYIAPGGSHLTVARNGASQRITVLKNDPPENGCRPSASVLFRSAAEIYREGVIAVVLTGMGTDGASGLSVLKKNGAHIIVQDKATSVVWGMPGAAVATGQVDQVLALDKIPAAINAIINNKGGNH